MQGSRRQALMILVRSVSATLRITVATLFDVYRGTYRREIGDRRLRWWSSRLLDLVRARCVVVGDPSPALPHERPLIVMSNHASLYDIPLLFVALPGSMRMLTKKELFRVPIWGRGLAAGEFVSIDRHDHSQALKDLDVARERMRSGISLWIAPEGTRSRDGDLGEFKKGGVMLAIQTGATILPVGIRGSRDILPPKTFFDVRLGCAPEVHIGEPIDASAYTVERRDELVALLRDRISDLAGLEKRGLSPFFHPRAFAQRIAQRSGTKRRDLGGRVRCESVRAGELDQRPVEQRRYALVGERRLRDARNAYEIGAALRRPEKRRNLGEGGDVRRPGRIGTMTAGTVEKVIEARLRILARKRRHDRKRTHHHACNDGRRRTAFRAAHPHFSGWPSSASPTSSAVEQWYTWVLAPPHQLMSLLRYGW